MALHDLIANVEDILHLAYLIPTALPSVINQGEAKEVSLPTFPLPNDACKITSPIPFAVYPCCAFADNPSPFLHNYYKFYNNYNSSILPSSQPPCEESSILFLTSPPSSKPAVETALDLAHTKKQEESLRKLEEPQKPFHKTSKIKGDYGAWNKTDPSFDPPKDKICIVTQNNQVRELEVVLRRPGWPPFSTYDYSKQRSFLDMTPMSPLPSLASSSDMTEDELADNEEDDQDDDSSTYGSDYSNYPAPHPKFITTALFVVLAIKTYNPYEDPCFNSSKSRTHTITRLDMIPFVDGKFDGRGRYAGNNEYTTQLLPSLEYSEEFTPIPFSGKFPTVFSQII